MSGYGDYEEDDTSDRQHAPRGLMDEWWTDNVLVVAFWGTAAAVGFLIGGWFGTLS